MQKAHPVERPGRAIGDPPTLGRFRSHDTAIRARLRMARQLHRPLRTTTRAAAPTRAEPVVVKKTVAQRLGAELGQGRKSGGRMMFHHSKNNTHSSRSAGGRSSVDRLKVIGELPRRVQARFEEHPGAAFAVVAALSFALGGLTASKLGRVALVAALPILIQRALEGDIGKDIARSIQSFLEPPGGVPAADGAS
jgi:hypothetical protein